MKPEFDVRLEQLDETQLLEMIASDLASIDAEMRTPLPRRPRQAVEFFLQSLGAILRRRLNAPVALALGDGLAVDRLRPGWRLGMEFRVFQHYLRISLPLELVEQLTALL